MSLSRLRPAALAHVGGHGGCLVRPQSHGVHAAVRDLGVVRYGVSETGRKLESATAKKALAAFEMVREKNDGMA